MPFTKVLSMLNSWNTPGGREHDPFPGYGTAFTTLGSGACSMWPTGTQSCSLSFPPAACLTTFINVGRHYRFISDLQ